MATSQKPTAAPAAPAPAPAAKQTTLAPGSLRPFNYTMAKGYPDSHKGKVISWNVPTSIRAILDGGFAPDEQTIAEVFVRQLNIKKGHAVQAAVLAKDAKPEDVTLDKLTEIGRKTVFGKITGERARGGKTAAVKQAAERAEKITGAALAKIRTYDESTLRTMLDVGVYTQEQVDAELARRASGAK